MCVEIPVDTPPVNLYYLDDVEQLLHWRYIWLYYSIVYVTISAKTHLACISMHFEENEIKNKNC